MANLGMKIKDQKESVVCDNCSCFTSLITSIKANNQYYCSTSCSLKAQETMPGRRNNKSRTTKKISAFDWGSYLEKNKEEAAPISCFKHCMTDSWCTVALGTVAEVPLPRSEIENPGKEVVYWFAKVMKLAGYKAKLRYEGCGNDSTFDFWVSICSPDTHEIGWCTTNSKQIRVPTSLKNKRDDWKDFLVKRLVGTVPYPENFYTKFLENVGKHKFCTGMIVEVVDKLCIAAVRVARIIETVDCRLHLQYVGGNGNDADDFWCHKDSSLIHPIGWAVHVGHRLHASPDYIKSSHDSYIGIGVGPDDCTKEIFSRDPSELVVPTDNGQGFAVGMKLEAIDPLNLSTICIATVMKVLKDNYLMIGIDGCMDSSHGSDWFCYHATSASIMPIGYCDTHNLPLTLPKGYKEKFIWQNYLSATSSKAAPVACFTTRSPRHMFKPGMKLEAVDLMDPRLICVATVERCVGRLLRIHFDGWESSYDQWIDCESPDIYPVGWCEMVNYSLEGPKQTPNLSDAKRIKLQ